MADISSDINTTAEITIGGLFTGELENRSDTDWIRIELAPGDWVTVTNSSYGTDGVVDPLIRVYQQIDGSEYVDATTVQVGSDDEQDSSGADLDASVTFGGGAGGVYSIEATSYAFSSGSFYQLEASYASRPRDNDVVDTLIGTDTSSDNEITVYFASAGETKGFGSDRVTADEWSTYERERVEAALLQISAVANITFTITDDPNADLEFILDDLNDDSLLGYYASTGYIVFNTEGQGWSSDEAGGGLEDGGLGFNTVTHEVMHAIGFEHLHEDEPGVGNDSEAIEGVDVQFNDFGVNGLNQGIFSSLSYNAGYNNQGYAEEDSGNGIGPMALDIAALQDVYGANTTTGSGDDVYVLSASDAQNGGWLSIWDTGGIDTIEVDNSDSDALEGGVIDLRAATLTYGPGGGGYVSMFNDANAGFTIANGVVIENVVAVGTTGLIIYGNDADNSLTAEGLGNVSYGHAGDDEISTGFDSDAYGGTGNDTITSVEDTITAYGNSGNDIITGSTDSNIVAEGGSGSDFITGGGDSGDILNGGSGDDTIVGDITSTAKSGNSVDDTLNGGRGRDTLDGGNGNDLIDGGWGADNLTGGAGEDTFIFAYASDSGPGESNRDTITDFTSGEDVIDLTGLNTSLTFIGDDAFSAAGHVRFETTGDDLIISADLNGDGAADMEILAQGIAGMTADDFLL